jgi:hypothetical protein
MNDTEIILACAQEMHIRVIEVCHNGVRVFRDLDGRVYNPLERCEQWAKIMEKMHLSAHFNRKAKVWSVCHMESGTLIENASLARAVCECALRKSHPA